MATSTSTGSISSPGIGSGLDVTGIVSKLMAVEAQPVTLLQQKEASYQAKISAFGNLSGALSSFQTSLSALSSPNTFQTVKATPADTSIFTASATNKAIAGTYNVNVTQVAQAQTISSAGQASSTATIGSGTSSTLTFQFGTVSGGNFISQGSALNANVVANGIGPNSLSLNGTTIITNSSTNSAKALATQINLLTNTTGVTATAQATDTGVLAFTPVTTGVGDAYSLVVDGSITLANLAASSSLTAAQLDSAISSNAAAFASDGITVTGSAVGGDLHFTKADGSNVSLTQTLTNTSGGASGGIAGLTSGTAKNYTSSISLSSSSAIVAGGNNPAVAGLYSGTLSSVYSGSSFTQDASQASANITIDSSNNTLQGIRDAINKGSFGVTASIVSDGSSNPYHLVLTSGKTGITSTMNIAVSGDSALGSLLAYNPGGTQNMSQSTAAQSTALTVNGIAVTSATQTVSEAIQGTTLTVNKVGTSSLTIASDTASVTSGVSGFVSAYNSLASTLSSLTSYDASTQQGGLLLGDSTALQIQTQIRGALSASLSGLGGSLTNLTQVGITFQKDGTMALDSSKLQTAVANNFSDIGALFATIGTSTDSLVSYVGSSAATKAGSYAVNVTNMATQGKTTGSAAAGLTIIAGVNDQLSMTVNSVSDSIKLVPGTYTADALAAQVQSAINGAAALSAAGIAVNVSHDSSGIFTIQSNSYGAISNVNIGGNGSGNLLGSTPASAIGTDVSGTIGGIAATGAGQVLTGTLGSNTSGLQIKITGGTTGSRGTLNYSQGYAYQLSSLVGNYVGTSGLIASSTTGLNASIKDVTNEVADWNTRLTALQAQYLAQFTALDTLVSNMNQTQSFLTQELAQIKANSSSS